MCILSVCEVEAWMFPFRDGWDEPKDTWVLNPRDVNC